MSSRPVLPEALPDAAHPDPADGPRLTGQSLTGQTLTGQRLTVRSLLTVGFLLALVGLLLVGGIAYVQIGTLARQYAPVLHTYEVLDEIGAMRALLNEEESAQRGYLLTGQKNHLDRQVTTRPLLEASLVDLRALTDDTPASRPPSTSSRARSWRAWRRSRTPPSCAAPRGSRPHRPSSPQARGRGTPPASST